MSYAEVAAVRDPSRPIRRTPASRFEIVAVACVALAGCGGVSEFAADTTAGFLADAAPAVRAYFDYESAGDAAANGIIQLEGLHRVSPSNERISLSLAQAYVAYAFGWVMDGQEQAELDGDYERADREQFRAYLMYSRAKQLALGIMRQRDPGIERVLTGDPDKLGAYLREQYDDPDLGVRDVLADRKSTRLNSSHSS